MGYGKKNKTESDCIGKSPKKHSTKNVFGAWYWSIISSISVSKHELLTSTHPPCTSAKHCEVMLKDTNIHISKLDPYQPLNKPMFIAPWIVWHGSISIDFFYSLTFSLYIFTLYLFNHSLWKSWICWSTPTRTGQMPSSSKSRNRSALEVLCLNVSLRRECLHSVGKGSIEYFGLSANWKWGSREIAFQH